jgi:hypothetical protein
MEEPGPPPPAPAAGDTPPVAAELQDGAPKSTARPPWMTWLVALGVVTAAVAAFGVARAMSHNHNSSSASAANASQRTNQAGGFGYGRNGSRFAFGRDGTAGTITAIDGSTLTVKSAAGKSVQVATTGSTRITVTTSVALTAVSTGDTVTVTGSRSGTTLAATRVVDVGASTGLGGSGAPGGFAGGQPPAGRSGYGFGGGDRPRAGALTAGRFAFGTVTQVSGSQLRVRSFDGTTLTVTTSSSTTVTKRTRSNVGALHVGQSIVAVGSTASDGTVSATAITEGEAGLGGFSGRRFGGIDPSGTTATTGVHT